MASLSIRISTVDGGDFDGAAYINWASPLTTITTLGPNSYLITCPRPVGLFDFNDIVGRLAGLDAIDLRSVNASGQPRVTDWLLERTLVFSPGIDTCVQTVHSPRDPLTPGDNGFPLYDGPAPVPVNTADTFFFGGSGEMDLADDPTGLTGHIFVPTGYQIGLVTTGGSDPLTAIFTILPVATGLDFAHGGLQRREAVPIGP